MDGLKGVLLNTGFLIRLVNANDPYHGEASKYFKFCEGGEVPVFLSTIAISEYCVKGKIKEIPVSQLRILPFNAPEAVRAGKIGEIAFKMRKDENLSSYDRKCLKEDTKILAQAMLHDKITHILVFDSDFITLSNHVKQQEVARNWKKPIIINPRETPLNTLLGEFDFE